MPVGATLQCGAQQAAPRLDRSGTGHGLRVSRHGSVDAGGLQDRTERGSLQLAGALRQHVADDPGGLEPSFVLAFEHVPKKAYPNEAVFVTAGSSKHKLDPPSQKLLAQMT